MVQLILLRANRGSFLALQDFNIIVRGLGAAAFATGYIEVAAAQRHHINARLVGTASVLFGRPVGAAIAAGRPLVTNVCTILGSDGEEGATTTRGLIAGAVVGVLFLIASITK